MKSPRPPLLALPLLTLLSALPLALACSEAEPAAVEAADDPAAKEPTREDMLRIMSPAEVDALDGERGVVVSEAAAFQGYTLIEPLNGQAIHLVDMEGEIVHTWPTDSSPGACSYLLEDGGVLRAGREDDDPRFRGGGIGGRIQRLAPDGTVTWHYQHATEDTCQHHDLELLPNGNVLFVAWERKSAEEAVAMGRNPAGVGKVGLWPDAVLEVKPTPPEGGEIVWEWHAWDHLVQDVDPAKPNHGAIADHPGRLDVNHGYEPEEEATEEEREEAQKLADQIAALGYGGGAPEEEEEEDGPPPRDVDKSGDWLHTNSVAYCAEHDLIVLSSPELCELFVIDHSTTTAEAATSSGGRFGKGGDLLWRWGNPAAHGVGTEADQKLFYQHNPTWLVDGDDLGLLVFNNGGGRSDGDRSSVEELVLPFDPEEGFVLEPGRAASPEKPVWTYEDADTFFSAFISGAQRLPNGNTLICSGAPGRVFEVTPAGEVVWDFYSPYGGEVDPPDHAGKAPPLSLFRATRYAVDHPGVVAVLR